MRDENMLHISAHHVYLVNTNITSAIDKAPHWDYLYLDTDLEQLIGTLCNKLLANYKTHYNGMSCLISTVTV